MTRSILLAARIVSALLLVYTGSSLTAMAQTGQKAYVGNYAGGNVSVVDLDTHENIGSIDLGGNSPRGLALSSNGSVIYVAVTGGQVWAIDTATDEGQPLASGLTPEVAGMAVTPDDAKIYVTHGNTFSVTVLDAVTGDVITDIPVVANPVYTAMHPDGDRLYVGTSTIGTDNPLISVIDTAADTVTATIEAPYFPADMAVTPDGGRLFVSHEFDDIVSVFDTETHTLVDTIEVAAGPRGIAFDTDGETAYVASYIAGAASAIDTATLTLTGTVDVDGAAFMVGVADDGRTFATRYTSNDFVEFDIEADTLGAPIPVGGGPYYLTMGPGLIVATEDGPKAFRLSQPTPNPANDKTELTLHVEETQHVAVRIYDTVGRYVATAYERMLVVGEEAHFTIDTSSLAPGVYGVRVEGETFAETRRFTVVR